MKYETRQILENFVEKAHKLDGFHFDEHVKSVGFGIKGTRIADTDEWTIDFGLPDVKEQDAFVLTFRLFIQKNEPISFQNIHSILNDDISPELREGTIQTRRAYLDYLNSCSEYTVKIFEGHPTRRQMLETVLYGGLGHINDQATIQKFKNWSRDGLRANLLQQEFIFILLQILVFIKYLAHLMEKELGATIS